MQEQTENNTVTTPEEGATRTIPYWRDGHWETTVATAEVMDRIQAYGPTPHRTLEVAYGASNPAIAAAVKHRADQWDYDPAYASPDNPAPTGFDPAFGDPETAIIDPASPCAQGHAGSEEIALTENNHG